MNLVAIRSEARFRLKDEAKPYFWSDEWLDKAINEAEREACIRARLIEDASGALSSIDITAGETRYTLDERILDVLSCELESRPGSAFERWTLTDSDLVLADAPTADDVLLMTIIRLPMNDMEADDDKPEIRQHHHIRLIEWVLYRAYSIPDTDGFDSIGSDKALATFEQSFGARPTANVQRKHREKTGRVVRMANF